MKRILIHSLLSIGLALLLQSFTPWWGVVIATAISSYFIRLKGSSVFFSPLLSIGLLWAIQAYSISSSNDFILAEKIAVLITPKRQCRRTNCSDGTCRRYLRSL
jgi:hypothetical protein